MTTKTNESFTSDSPGMQVWWHGTTDSGFKNIYAPSFETPFFISDDPVEAEIYMHGGYDMDSSDSQLALVLINPDALVTFDWCDQQDLDQLKSIPEIIKKVLAFKMKSTFSLIQGMTEMSLFYALGQDDFEDFKKWFKLWLKKINFTRVDDIGDEDAQEVWEWLSSARSSRDLFKIRDLSEDVDCDTVNGVLYELFWSQLEGTKFNSFHEVEMSENIALCDASAIKGIWSRSLDMQEASDLMKSLMKSSLEDFLALRNARTPKEAEVALKKILPSNPNKQDLDETEQVDEHEITEDTKLFFVGTTESKYDLTAQKFKDYKELDKISIENAAFGTSTWGYACAYAKQYAKTDDHGVVVSFELKPGCEVFDLRDPNEYASLGIPREIAGVFADSEPYFAINTQIPAQQSGVKPPEFIAAVAWLKSIAGAKDYSGKESFLDLLEKVDANKLPKTADEMLRSYGEAYADMLRRIFVKFFGEAKQGKETYKKNEKLLMTKRFNSIDELMKLGAKQVYTPKMHAKRFQLFELRKQFLKQKGLDARANIKPSSELYGEFVEYLKLSGFTDDPQKIDQMTPNKSYTIPTNAFNHNRMISLDEVPADRWKYRFKAMAEPTIQPQLESLPEGIQILAHNASLLYKNPKGNAEEDNEEPRATTLNGKSLAKMLGYAKLFQVCKQHILDMKTASNSEVTAKFQRGIARIKERMASDNKHIYIDYLQYVFFSLLMQSEKYIGVTCPEIRGYANIHRFSGRDSGKKVKPFGYAKEISASTLYYDDMTVILCKPLSEVIMKTFGHTIDFIDAEDYQKTIKPLDQRKQGRKSSKAKEIDAEKIAATQINVDEFAELVLPDINACHNVDDYKKVFIKDLKPYLDSQSKQT